MLDLNTLHLQVVRAVAENANPSGAVLELPEPLRLRISEADVCALELVDYIFRRWPETTECDFKRLLANAQWWVTFLASAMEGEGTNHAD